MPRIFELLQQAQQRQVARIDAQLLLLHACEQLGQNRAWLLTHDQDPVSSEHAQRFESALQRRLNGEPVAYITGFKAFYGLNLQITADVLDPRDDTETLVDWALELVSVHQNAEILDLGTGSGAIALALAAQRPQARITAADASAAALNVAQANALALQLPLRLLPASSQAAHWLSCVNGESFDLIVSNPPYIAQGDPHLRALRHEPELALTSGADGLEAIRSISAHASAHLRAGGWLLLEHGYNQAAAVQALLQAQGFERVSSRLDLAGVPRCTGGQFSG